MVFNSKWLLWFITWHIFFFCITSQKNIPSDPTALHSYSKGARGTFQSYLILNNILNMCPDSWRFVNIILYLHTIFLPWIACPILLHSYLSVVVSVVLHLKCGSSPNTSLRPKALRKDVLSFILDIWNAAYADLQQLLVEELLQKRGGDRNTKSIVQVPAPEKLILWFEGDILHTYSE